MLALLAARFGLHIADEAVQDALVEALGWHVEPDNPAAWLYVVARNRAVDRLRRQSAVKRREQRAASDLHLIRPAQADPALREEEEMLVIDDGEVGDEQLRLMLLCAHPALARDSQIALTLRLVGGLATVEIAGALLLPEATLAQRIVRAKQKIRDAGIPLSVPDRLDERIEVLLGVLYLVFNEGYLSRGGVGSDRIDLMEESIRLTIWLFEQLPSNAEGAGLLALELYTRARSAARFRDGRLVLLADQDRSLWDRELIEQADGLLRRSLRSGEPGPYALQAAIAECHARAMTADDTDWPRIVSLYTSLLAATNTPVVALNRVVAVSMADGPLVALRLLGSIAGLQDYYLYWSTRGELLAQTGRTREALRDFQRAASLAINPAERHHLEARIADLEMV